MQDRKNISLFSGGSLVLIGLFAVGAVAAVYRLTAGLGAATNLSDQIPWGIWIAFDVFVGVALAAGGFAITAAVYVFNLKKYRPIVRPAVLTAFLGYLMVVAALIIDIGKPQSFWHPLVMWQPRSVMFEVVWCVILYTTVLTLEFAPQLLERIGMRGLAGVMRKKAIVFPLVIAGVTLSYLHQSSLGALFLIAPAKLHGLWYTPLIPQLFFLSAIAVGLAMVSIESILSSRILKHGYQTEILDGLARATAVTLAIYLLVRFLDLALRGNIPLLLEGGTPALLFLLEVITGVILPMALLFSPGIRRSPTILLITQLLVVGGVIQNRLNANFLTQAAHGGSYFPSWMELAVTIGLVSLGVFLYRFAVLRLQILPESGRNSS